MNIEYFEDKLQNPFEDFEDALSSEDIRRELSSQTMYFADSVEVVS